MGRGVGRGRGVLASTEGWARRFRATMVVIAQPIKIPLQVAGGPRRLAAIPYKMQVAMEGVAFRMLSRAQRSFMLVGAVVADMLMWVAWEGVEDRVVTVVVILLKQARLARRTGGRVGVVAVTATGLTVVLASLLCDMFIVFMLRLFKLRH